MGLTRRPWLCAAMIMMITGLAASAVGGIAEIAAAPLEDFPRPQEAGRSTRGAAPRLVIERRGDLLTVRLRHASWEAVIQELERHTGIKIQVEGLLAGALTQEFEALPLEQGLRRLFREANLLFFYAAETKEGASAQMLVRVWVLPKEGRPAAARQPRHPSSPATAAEQQEELDTESQFAEATQGEEGAQSEAEPEGEIEARLKALDTLAEEGHTEALQQALFDPDLTIQATAFDLLTARDARGAIAALVEATTSDQPEMRLQALQRLHQADQAENGTVLSTLGQALGDEDPTVRGYAIHALADRGGSEALGLLHQALRDPDPIVRTMVLEHAVHKEQGLPLLHEALSDDDEAVRSAAAALLEQRVPAVHGQEGKTGTQGSQQGKGAR